MQANLYPAKGDDVQIGSVREIKEDEHRVGITPSGVRELSRGGHRVLVQAGAGLGIGASDQSYVSAGATILPSAADVAAGLEFSIPNLR